MTPARVMIWSEQYGNILLEKSGEGAAIPPEHIAFTEPGI
jgi:hypothetical protein|nr:MAG TPA: hypothetical protein [Caudoviricetes sp.]